MLRPIPRSLLIHTATLRTISDPDKWGNGSSTEITLSNIRIEPTAKSASTTDGTSIQLTAVLFFDSHNSTPSDCRFALAGDITGSSTVKLQQVVFGGRTFTVKSIDVLYADNALPHHTEVGLL